MRDDIPNRLLFEEEYTPGGAMGRGRGTLLEIYVAHLRSQRGLIMAIFKVNLFGSGWNHTRNPPRCYQRNHMTQGTSRGSM